MWYGYNKSIVSTNREYDQNAYFDACKHPKCHNTTQVKICNFARYEFSV